MSFSRAVSGVSRFFRTMVEHPVDSAEALRNVPPTVRARVFANRWSRPNGAAVNGDDLASEPNPLRQYFDAHQTGRGIWKWTHYFDVYHRHFSRFRGREVRMVEIGIFS